MYTLQVKHTFGNSFFWSTSGKYSTLKKAEQSLNAQPNKTNYRIIKQRSK